MSMRMSPLELAHDSGLPIAIIPTKIITKFRSLIFPKSRFIRPIISFTKKLFKATDSPSKPIRARRRVSAGGKTFLLPHQIRRQRTLVISSSSAGKAKVENTPRRRKEKRRADPPLPRVAQPSDNRSFDLSAAGSIGQIIDEVDCATGRLAKEFLPKDEQIFLQQLKRLKKPWDHHSEEMFIREFNATNRLLEANIKNSAEIAQRMKERDDRARKLRETNQAPPKPVPDHLPPAKSLYEMYQNDSLYARYFPKEVLSRLERKKAKKATSGHRDHPYQRSAQPKVSVKKRMERHSGSSKPGVPLQQTFSSMLLMPGAFPRDCASPVTTGDVGELTRSHTPNVPGAFPPDLVETMDIEEVERQTRFDPTPARATNDVHEQVHPINPITPSAPMTPRRPTNRYGCVSSLFSLDSDDGDIPETLYPTLPTEPSTPAHGSPVSEPMTFPGADVDALRAAFPSHPSEEPATSDVERCASPLPKQGEKAQYQRLPHFNEPIPGLRLSDSIALEFQELHKAGYDVHDPNIIPQAMHRRDQKVKWDQERRLQERVQIEEMQGRWEKICAERKEEEDRKVREATERAQREAEAAADARARIREEAAAEALRRKKVLEEERLRMEAEENAKIHEQEMARYAEEKRQVQAHLDQLMDPVICFERISERARLTTLAKQVPFSGEPIDPVLSSCYSDYEQDWRFIQQAMKNISAGNQIGRLIWFHEIPWPIFGPIPCFDELENPDAIVAFLTYKNRPGYEHQSNSKRLRNECLKWHPDKTTRLLQLVQPEQRHLVSAAAEKITRILTEKKDSV